MNSFTILQCQGINLDAARKIDYLEDKDAIVIFANYRRFFKRVIYIINKNDSKKVAITK